MEGRLGGAHSPFDQARSRPALPQGAGRPQPPLLAAEEPRLRITILLASLIAFIMIAVPATARSLGLGNAVQGPATR